MSKASDSGKQVNVRQRLLDAGLSCFLAEDYHRVSMRRVATLAETNMSMIYYYFGNKEGLFEEVLRSWLQPMIDDLQPAEKDAFPKSFEAFFQMYYRSAMVHPRFPLIILSSLNSPKAPGSRFLCEKILERGRQSGLRWAEHMKESGEIAQDIDPELLRITVVSMAMLPMLVRDFLSSQLDKTIDQAFFDRLSAFYARVLTQGVTTTNKE